MICYKINIDLDKPIPTVRNKHGRNEYDDDAVNRINNALADHNRKHLGRRCAFICQDNKDRLSLGFVISDGTVLGGVLDELMCSAGISGRTEQEEITVKTLDKLTHFGFRHTFEFDSDDLDAFGIGALTQAHRPPEEKLAREYSYSELKKSAELGLYADSFLPEIDRIIQPAAIENANGHPVHYIVRTGCSMKVCDRLIDTLHRFGRLGSRRYTIVNFRQAKDVSETRRSTLSFRKWKTPARTRW